VRLFDVIDVDQSGTLSVEEVQQAAKSPAVAAFLKAAQEPALHALELMHCHGTDATNMSRADRLRIQRWKRALLDATQSDGTVREHEQLHLNVTSCDGTISGHDCNHICESHPYARLHGGRLNVPNFMIRQWLLSNIR